MCIYMYAFICIYPKPDYNQSSYEFWNSGKVLEFWRRIFQTWKVLEFCLKFWKVLENSGLPLVREKSGKFKVREKSGNFNKKSGKI